MRLRDLDARFIRYDRRVEQFMQIVGDPETWNQRGQPTEDVIGPREYMVPVDSMADAQGIQLDCPTCRDAHRIEVTFADRGVLHDQGTRNKAGNPTRWNVAGSGLDDLTTTPSIQLEGYCGWHGYITNGDAA